MKKDYFFTSESVSEGHPDKVCDRISDMVVDSYLSRDPFSRVACETLTTTNKVVLAGEVRGPELKEEELISKLDGTCHVPTRHNPFMNPGILDYNTNNFSEPACDSYNNKGIQREIEKQFNQDLYRDAYDIFGKNNSQRQFFSVPSRGVPNDQGGFAKWLYATPPTCKEGNGLQCGANQLGVGSGPGASSS